jgi:hypothetical protein
MTKTRLPADERAIFTHDMLERVTEMAWELESFQTDFLSRIDPQELSAADHGQLVRSLTDLINDAGRCLAQLHIERQPIPLRPIA